MGGGEMVVDRLPFILWASLRESMVRGESGIVYSSLQPRCTTVRTRTGLYSGMCRDALTTSSISCW